MADGERATHLEIVVARELHEAAAEQPAAVGAQARTLREQRVLRGDDARAAAAGAGDVQHGTLDDRDVVAAAHQDVAALAAEAGGIEPAAVDDPAARSAEHDFAADLFDARGTHEAAVVDRGRGQPLRDIGGHEHAAAVGHQITGVRDACGIADRRRVDAVADQPGVVEIERQCRARGQHHVAEAGLDQAAVADVAAREHHEAAVAGGERAVVDHARRRGGASQHVATGHEVFVSDVEGRGHQPADIHLGTLPEDHALRIDQQHAAIGVEVAEDGAEIAADDAVEHRRRGRGLQEVDGLAGPDVEVLPVDDRRAALLLDRREAGNLLDAGLAGDDGAVDRIGERQRRGQEARQQQHARPHQRRGERVQTEGGLDAAAVQVHG